jgi:hypothetical protein
MPEIKTFAKEHGVKSNGTRAQIIQRLRSHLGLENSMTKIFTSILGGSGRSRTYHSVTLILFLVSYISGGFVGACCPHGVVYAIKPIIRSESVRDHIDILLSLREAPIVVVSDLAPMIAAHGERRKPGLFWPHDGRLAAPTAENVNLAESGDLLCVIEGLEEEEIIHGLARYSLSDKFHEKNLSSKADILRRVHLFPQLAGKLNTQAMEQLFRQMGKDAYYLTQMTPAHFLFVLRLNIHLHNCATNDTLLKKLQKSVSESNFKDALCVFPVSGSILGRTHYRLYIWSPYLFQEHPSAESFASMPTATSTSRTHTEALSKCRVFNTVNYDYLLFFFPRYFFLQI